MKRWDAKTRRWSNTAPLWIRFSTGRAALALSAVAALACGGPKPAVSRHIPYATHACNSCHDTESSTSFGAYTAKFALPTPPAGSPLAPELDDKTRSRLRYRVDHLCFQCHQDLNPEAPRNRGLWLHGPFRAGVCLGCHDPHESSHPKLLVAYPWPALCARCHPGYHQGKPAPAGECRSCHSPHARNGPYPAPPGRTP